MRLRPSLRLALTAGALAATVAAAPAPAAAATSARSWIVRDVSPRRPAFLIAAAALPARGTAALLEERAGGENALVLRRSGRAARTLARSGHMFDASLGADRRGRLVVVWVVNGR